MEGSFNNLKLPYTGGDMNGNTFRPEKITSPFQLMAAWFLMLTVLVSILLAAAMNIRSPAWAGGYLVIFSTILIIIVIACVLLMLTAFRPHLQDGKEYAQWLKDKNVYSRIIQKDNFVYSRELSSVESEYIVPISTRANSKTLKIPVSVSNISGSDSLVSSLNDSNFSASVYDSSLSAEYEGTENHEAIWIGYRVPAKRVVEAIKIAKAHWPHLKYVELSNDGKSTPPDEVHSQIYIGGATATAIENDLKAWSDDDFNELEKHTTRNQLHAFIRKMYGSSASY